MRAPRTVAPQVDARVPGVGVDAGCCFCGVSLKGVSSQAAGICASHSIASP